MTYLLYDSFSIEDVDSIGKKFKARCISNRGYDGFLSLNEVYVITMTTRILPLSPLCSFMGDCGRLVECHVTRFEKIEAIDD